MLVKLVFEFDNEEDFLFLFGMCIATATEVNINPTSDEHQRGVVNKMCQTCVQHSVVLFGEIRTRELMGKAEKAIYKRLGEIPPVDFNNLDRYFD